NTELYFSNTVSFKMDIYDLIEAIQEERVRITDHADEEAVEDDLTFDEIYFSILFGEIIEQYPNNKPYPQYLVYGQTFSGDSVHSVWEYNKETKWAVIVTVYRPDPTKWINWRQRK
ncbi:MAG: DUF4258 domain-containing protein, partial [Snowella sp.]